MRKLFFLLITLSSCSGMLKSKISYDNSEQLRVAVLPFAQIRDGKIVEDTADVFLIDHIPGLSKASKKGPARIVQEQVVKELALSNLEVLPAKLVEAEILHDGFSKNNRIDTERLYRTKAADICKTLACDAVLYGKVDQWDRSYYGLQSVNTVSFNLKLVRAKDDKVIFSASAKDSESHGLTQGPTGYSSIILEPIRGLDSELIEQLSEKNVKSALEKLVLKKEASEIEIAPYIVSGAHTARALNLNRQQPLTVMAFGSPEVSAYFSIGSYIKNIPMKEVSPGHYLGYYLPIAEDNFGSEEITVTLINKSNRRSSLKVQPGPVSLQN